MDELLILNDEVSCNGLPSTINTSAYEMQLMYQEVFPYTYISTLTGDCLQWDEGFLTRLLYAFATDDTRALSDAEDRVLRDFIAFEDLKSTSVNSDQGVANAIGCTIPDSLGRSYVVTTDGIRYDVLCSAGQNSVAKEATSYSLDQVLMDMYNCEDYNDCGIKTGELVDISACPL